MEIPVRTFHINQQGDFSMIVVQCWDDGVNNDAPLADILRKHKAKACFNLNPGLHSQERKYGWSRNGYEIWKLGLKELKSVYEGFDIAGHSMTHPHPNQIEPEKWKSEVADCKKFLEDFFGFEVRGFAYPFGEYNDVTKEIVRECGHSYARTTKNLNPCYPPQDAMQFHSNCHFLSDKFWSEFESVKKADGVFYFWGHSYEIETEAMWKDFDEKIKRISEDKSVTWKVPADLF